MDLIDVKYWAGTDEALVSYLAAVRAQLAGTDKPPAGMYTHDSSQPERQSRLISKQGDVAVIKISGALNNSDSWMNEYRGMTGYPEIREALIQAAVDPGVKAIVLDVNSGGGAVSGVFDTAKLITKVDGIKPVHTFSDGGIMSAAYLLGSSARSLAIGKMTEAGSIGVVQIHQEISKMMAEAGVTPTVIRAGKYKALGNMYEPLTELAKTEMQASVDQMYEVFVDHVADRRKVSYEVADKKLAQGRIFLGERAVDIGLVDSVTTFDALMTKVQGGIDSKNAGSKYAPNLQQGNNAVADKKALTEQQVAALALGAGGATASAGTEGAPAAEPTEAEKAAAAAAAEPTEAEKAAAAAAAASTAAGGDLVKYLQDQLSDRDAKLMTATVELRDLKAKSDVDAASLSGFRAIATSSVSYLRVALGTSGADVAGMSDTALLAEQAALRVSFETKFKTGGVASVSAEVKTPDNGSDANGEVVRQARIAATRTGK